MSKKPRILFTTQLSEQKRIFLENDELLIESEPFITFEYLMPALWMDKLPDKADAWIFTSKKAVKAFSPKIPELKIPDHIFAVGAKTAEKLEELGLEVSFPEEYNALALAEMMKKLDFKKVVHFCGNLKAADLGKLLGESVEVVNIEVYHTVLTHHKMDDLNDFDAVVFMSPSAVESFSELNSVSEDQQVFCIGPTTEESAREFGMKNSITPEYFTLESLMESISQFYNLRRGNS
ncbi:uroporphyrinogen-III synthase [Gracilimonas amylolytica]|uniref:uroporphyrinogen-III synthase n=1 Tax=Gracilimonas amylolytica TaxID=1749045 RepID=UPI000CD936A3|nr:uroporphyrinogen-III synthase [Gracilimonas amylolytica]